MSDTDTRIKEHYSAQLMPDEILNKMVERAQSTDPRVTFMGRVRDKLQSNWVPVLLAQALLVVVSLFVHNGSIHAERTDRALKEVAMNHSTRLDLEFENASIEALDEQMVLLPFDVALPDRVAANYIVKGARYCSLSGQLAVHIELAHTETNKTLSVFMTRAADELDAIDSSDELVDGVDVKIWRESGLLYAMVGSFDPSEDS